MEKEVQTMTLRRVSRVESSTGSTVRGAKHCRIFACRVKGLFL